MSYQKPIVMVFQEYEDLGVTPPDTELTPCIVGPAYHIIDLDDSDDKELGYVGDWSELTLSEVEVPENKAGAEVDEDSVNVLFEDVKINITDGSVDIDSMSDDVITFSESDFPSDAKEDDRVKVVDSDDNEVFSQAKIVEVDSDEYKITLDRSVEDEITSGTVEIFREVDDKTVSLEDDDSDISISDETLDLSNFKIDDYEIREAKVYVGYRSFRTDLSRVNTIYNTDEAEGKLGKLNYKENPLGMGVNIALSNTTGPVKFIGIDEDDQQGFYNAESTLETNDNVYAIVPLTTESAVASSFVSHCEQMSEPEEGQWRVVIFGSELSDEEILSDGEGKPKEDSNDDPLIFKDEDAEFISDGVKAGDILRLKHSDNDEEDEYVISGAISEDRVLLDEEIDTDKYNIDSTYDYEIYKELDRAGQADYIKNISEGYSSKRGVHVWPDKCVIQGQEVPGYFLACAVAGATGGLPSHRGFTRLSISGVDEIINSNDYFNKSQLNTIASGGTFIFTQENPDSPIVVRHQLTTDMSAVEFQEFSFVKNFDYVSILSKEALDRYLGQYNITKATFGVLENSMRALLESLKLYKLPKIGSPVLKYEIDNIYQHEEDRTRVEMYVNVWFPYALNIVGLHLVSQGTTKELTE